MNVYAESSAVLAWLLGEDAGPRVRQALTAAEAVVTSDLTLIECERVLVRAVVLGETSEAAAADRRAHLNVVAAHWNLVRISPEIVDRAKHRFPGEPIRTLDAIHLASALTVRSVMAGLEILSLDDRVCRAAAQLGFRIHPE